MKFFETWLKCPNEAFFMKKLSLECWECIIVIFHLVHYFAHSTTIVHWWCIKITWNFPRLTESVLRVWKSWVLASKDIHTWKSELVLTTGFDVLPFYNMDMSFANFANFYEVAWNLTKMFESFIVNEKKLVLAWGRSLCCFRISLVSPICLTGGLVCGTFLHSPSSNSGSKLCKFFLHHWINQCWWKRLV